MHSPEGAEFRKAMEAAKQEIKNQTGIQNQTQNLRMRPAASGLFERLGIVQVEDDPFLFGVNFIDVLRVRPDDLPGADVNGRGKQFVIES